MSVDNLQALGNVILDIINQYTSDVILMAIPNIVTTILLLLFGYFLSKFLGLSIKELLLKLGVDDFVKKTGKHKALGHMSMSALVGGMFRWYIFSLFLIGAGSYLQIDILSQLLLQVALWIPRLIAGIIIIIAGIIIADYVESKLNHAKKIKWIRLITPLIKILLIIFFISAAFEQIGISIRLAEASFLIILGGFVLAISLMVGIPIGFALRKEAEQTIKYFKRKWK